MHKNKVVNILVDSGSTFNFVQPWVANILELPQMEITSFKVFVGSGEFILCKATSEAIPIVIQGISFVVDLHHLDIVGADMVFGVAWMRSVGRILIDYDRLTIEFILQGQHVS